MVYLPRYVDRELDELLPVAAAIALEGAKGVGKTGTAMRRAETTLFLEDPVHDGLLDADPTLAGIPPGTVLLDEWQRKPQVWDMVRRQVDAAVHPGRFLLTGSATPTTGAGTHSGAGRILSLRMRPMSLPERGLVDPTVSLAAFLSGRAPAVAGDTPWMAADYFEAIEASGLPGLAGLSGRMRRAQLDAYLQRVIDRDLPDQGLAVRRPETLRRWLAAYAAASSSTTSYSRILDATTAGDGRQPAKTSTIAYRDHLTQLFLLDPVPGWSSSRSPLSRLQQAPKHQLVDPALAARLLSVTAATLGTPAGAHMAGPLFESLATLTVRAAAQPLGARVGHLRTGNGDHEVDLVVEGEEGQVLGVEVKLAAAITDKDVRHLLWLQQQLPNEVVDLMVISSGSRAYRRPDGVAVVPLALLGG